MKKRNLVSLALLVTLFFQITSEAQSKLEDFTQTQIGDALKEALDHGVRNQVNKLTRKDGFYKNELVKIVLPDELKKVDKRLRRLGLSKLLDEALVLLNRGAEDAVKTATPIFVESVKNISFQDAKEILMGEKDAATRYLQNETSVSLYEKFNPVIKKSFGKVGADKIWADIVSKYNGLPFVKKVNPDLTDYVTQESMKGVFTMIAIEEEGIRKKIGLRDTELLRKVFSLQDLLKKK